MTGLTLCGEKLPRAAHVCAFFRSPEEKYATLAPFFGDVLREGDRIINVVEEAGRNAHIRHLEAAGLPATDAMQGGDLSVRTCEETYARNGQLDLENMLHMLGGVLESSKAEGRCVRTCGEMNWVMRSPGNLARVLDYESRVNDFLPRFECTLMCVYDLTNMSATVVSDILATHPYAIINGRLRPNPYAVPAAEYRNLLRQMT